MTPGRPIVISAPSGAGKSSLIGALLRRLPALQYSISATTRPPRPGEVEGVHYFFKTPEQFQAMQAAGALAEYNEVHGNFYGTPCVPLDAALRQGRSVVLDLDVYGKVNFDRVYPDALGILIVPPSFAELEHRLLARGTDAPQTIVLRLKNARAELEFARTHGKYEHTVVNDDFNRALMELQAVVEAALSQLDGA